MSILLADALKELGLKPGESRCVAVDDYEVEIRRPTLMVDAHGGGSGTDGRYFSQRATVG